VIVSRQAAGGISGGQLSVHVGTTVFRALSIWELILILFIAPALTAGAIAGERERQTLDLLLCTRVRPSSIVVGKLVASLLFALLLLLASVPVFSVVFLFGGVELSQVVGVAAVLGITALVIGSIGLLFSTAMRRPMGATVVALIVAFLYIAVPMGTSVIYPTSIASRTPQAYAEFGNPAFALGSTLLATPIRSPVNAPAPQSITQAPTRVGPSGQQCTVTSTGSFCTSVGSGLLIAPSTAPTAPVLIPQNDKVQAGIFHGLRAWQAFALISLVVVVVLVAASVAILSRRHVPLPSTRRRRAGPPELPAPEAAGA
jgi:ABC-type transport system involved in multi-copper enzyme maturation permease subunit